MHHRYIFACTGLCASLCVGSAGAEEKVFRDWFAACDNVRNCSALAIKADTFARAYVRIDRDCAPKATPRIAVFVDIEKGERFRLAFDDLTTDGLPDSPITSTVARTEYGSEIWPDEDGRMKVEITAIEPFLAALRKVGKITVERIDEKKPAEPIEVSLAGASASLLWMDEQQRRLDSVTALVRRGKKPVSAVPCPPPPPVVREVKPSAGPVSKAFPPAVAAKLSEACADEDDDSFGAEIGEAAHLNSNLLLYRFKCHNLSGAYNPSSAFVIAPIDNPAAARLVEFPLPPDQRGNGKATTHQLSWADYNAKTLTLQSIALAHGPGDCGYTYEWVWNGKTFRLTEYRSMPICAGLTPKDWPVVYRAPKIVGK